MTYSEEDLIKMLSAQPQPAVPWYARLLGFLTTPFKFLGISGWTDTVNHGRGQGKLVRPAAHSTDGFYTLDLQLLGFFIDDVPVALPEPRYLRLEVEPFTDAHKTCKAHRKLLVEGETVIFEGEIYIDADGPFLEIHPTHYFWLPGLQ